MTRMMSIPRPEYVECQRCFVLVHRDNAGPALHAQRHHPRVTVVRYLPAPDRLVPAEDLEVEQPWS